MEHRHYDCLRGMFTPYNRGFKQRYEFIEQYVCAGVNTWLSISAMPFCTVCRPPGMVDRPETFPDRIIPVFGREEWSPGIPPYELISYICSGFPGRTMDTACSPANRDPWMETLRATMHGSLMNDIHKSRFFYLRVP